MENTPVNKDERMWAMFCHLFALSGIIGVPFGHVLGPLVAWLIKKDEYPLVNDQGKESLNFQISVTIYGFGLMILAVLAVISIVGIFVALPAIIVIASVWWVIELILVITAAMRANEGIAYRYPVTIRFFQ